MAVAPYRIIEKRSSHGATNNLYEVATPNGERKDPPDLHHDTQKNVSDYGRRAMVNLCKKMFVDIPALKGMVLEQANLSVSSFLPQWYGTDKTWRKMAESWIQDEWLKICDVRGEPYDGDSYLDLHVIGELRDGDFATLLTERSGGYPALQIIPVHRIRSRLGVNHTARVRLVDDQMWVDGIMIDTGRPYTVPAQIEWDAPLWDGKIIGPYGEAIAYRVCSDETWDYSDYQDVSARNLILRFTPEWSDQHRGFPLIASGAWDWQDVGESRRFSLAAQKVESAIYAWETSPSGGPSSATTYFQEGLSGNATTKTPATPTIIELKGGIRYGQSGAGSKIEFPSGNRPSQQSQAYQQTVMRDAMAGAEWSYIFGCDPSSAGGAGLRIVVERINRVLDKRRKSPAKSFKRVIGYAISRAIKLGILPPNDEWWRWGFQGQKQITADAKYDSDVALQEVRMGISTRKKQTSARGDDPDWTREQKYQEADELLEDAQKLSTKYKLPIQSTQLLLSDLSSSSTVSSVAQAGNGSDLVPQNDKPQDLKKNENLV